MRRLGLLLIAGAMLVTGCESDKVLAGRKVLEKDPAKAIALFTQASQEQSPCFECLAYLGYALEVTGDIDGAVEVYLQAADLPEVASRPEPVRQRLLAIYENQFNQAAGDARMELATKAAALETTLKTSRPWANQALADTWLKQMKDAAAAGNEALTRSLAAKIQGLYLPAERKQQAARDATEALRTIFIGKVTKALEGELGETLAQMNRIDKDSKEIVLAHEFTIPKASVDPKYDPRSADFEAALRADTCLPLRAQLDEVMTAAAPVLGLKGVDKEGLDRVFANLYKGAQAGINLWQGDKRTNPAGLPYLCQIRVAYHGFGSELFRFSE